ncbi:regulatory signaling modulator protein AmpE [Legionella fairfieldensis]|uniref:regulatory signaling modulator protein AmpE n=1 Tax=Legionella fairfieldensis TaxID=45064 RepID=UPI00048CBB2A|nr:regulatory signaling modulator protein AmpE [Legionella fairfieldensis]
MKLLVIVLCLLSERFLVHALSYKRFYWFSSYFDAIRQRLPQNSFFSTPAVGMIAVIFPVLFITGLVFLVFNHVLFGFIGLLLNLAIFYYCLGPENSFYPVRQEMGEEHNEMEAGRYFAKVNGQLFAVIFWYIITGASGVLIYRLISLCRYQELTAKLAASLTNILDWIPVRLTVFLYLLVGNFQRGIHFFIQKLPSSPENNTEFLSEGGLLAARTSDNESVQMSYAESLVEHALIVYLVFIAFFTLVAWLK